MLVFSRIPSVPHRLPASAAAQGLASLVIRAMILFAAVAPVLPLSALAQTKPAVTTTVPAPAPTPAAPAPAPAKPATPETPQKPAADTSAPDVKPMVKSVLKLKAMVTDDGPPITSGLVWRVFRENGDGGSDAKMQLIATFSGGDAEFRLDPGSYVIHAAYGRAGTTTKVELTQPMRSETLVLNAGGVKLNALLTGELAIPEDKLTFDVYAKDADSGGEKQALVRGAAANKVIRLNADTYQIVSHYGTVNAVVRAEIHVNPGKLTEATVYHKAAQVTLKLVTSLGGEALTNVEWAVLTPGGDPVADSEGTFADMVLAEGDYTVVAKHQDQVYTRTFSVETGYNREIEVLATKPQPKPGK